MTVIVGLDIAACFVILPWTPSADLIPPKVTAPDTVFNGP
jgi:hypothetical protein